MRLKRMINPAGEEVLVSVSAKAADAKETLDSFKEQGYTEPKQASAKSQHAKHKHNDDDSASEK